MRPHGTRGISDGIAFSESTGKRGMIRRFFGFEFVNCMRPRCDDAPVVVYSRA